MADILYPNDQGNPAGALPVRLVTADGSAFYTASEGGTSGPSMTDGSGNITTGGTAQQLFGGVVPAHGYAVYNPSPSVDLWVSHSTTAAPNGAGSIRVSANGGAYETPPGVAPGHAVSIYGATTGQPFTADTW